VVDRYCGNCGNALAEDDLFCPKCGKPVHETAAVPTPEADVAVPPLPQQDTRDAPGPTRTRPFLYQSCLNVGCAVILILIVGVVLLALIGSVPGG
jgi:uncharacterized membrane protein YvbJ